jgi:hypothetical protein
VCNETYVEIGHEVGLNVQKIDELLRERVREEERTERNKKTIWKQSLTR